MPNLQDYIIESPLAKKFKVDELLFAELICPSGEESISGWWHNNFFVHVLSGKMVLKTLQHEYTLTAGDAAFAKKGSVITYGDIHEDLCEVFIFVPDDFIKSVVRKYNLLHNAPAQSETGDTIIPLAADEPMIPYSA